MGQGDILRYLRRCKKPKSSTEIEKALKTHSGACLKRLRSFGEVNFKRVKAKRGGAAYIYWSKENERNNKEEGKEGY